MKFIDFVKLCFCTLSPNTKYHKLPHIRLIADRLEAAMEGKVLRIIFNMPPRSMKSMCISVAWPAWILGQNPSSKIIVASYSQLLSEKHSLDTRYIVQSEWYKNLFPHVTILKDQNTKHKFTTTMHGYRFATSVGGTITGEGGDFIIVDDPITPMQSESESYMRKVANWFDQSLSTRLNDKRKSVLVLVMHRLHPEDLTNHLLSKKGSKWHLLSLPMISKKNERFFSRVRNKRNKKRKIIFKRKIGDLLSPRRESLKQINITINDIGSFAFAAQYQQDPILFNSEILKIEWFKRYNNTPEEFDTIIQSWDTSASESKSSDFTVCTTWIKKNNLYYLINVLKIKCEYPKLKTMFVDMALRMNPNSILIENKSSGQQLIQEFKNNLPYSILAINPISDKYSRFKKIVPIIESGRVFLPYSSNWLWEFEKEIMQFPNSKNDDQADSFSQFLLWSHEQSIQKYLGIKKL